jgi:DNA (cytosine-5)-methyltransferase 1
MSTLPVRPRASVQPRSPSLVSEVMGRVSSRDTEPETIFRKALRRGGLRSFRACDASLPGKPDIVLPGKGLAIFIDGDFWHGHQYQARGFESVQAQLFGVHNAEYWTTKISRNVGRDFQNTSALLTAGWRVLRFWESNIRKSLDKCVAITLDSMEKVSERAAFSALPDRTAVELFAGIGLVRLAMDRSGWHTVFANDNDPQKLAMYSANFGIEGFDPRSVHDLAPSDIPTCSLITASFPCNDLSVAGAREGLNGRHSSTFWALIRLLRGMKSRRPPLVLLENVVGFLSSHGGKDLESALLTLNELGYFCDVLILDAAEFVPQSRVRLFVVARHGNVGVPGFPVAPSQLRPKALVDFINCHPLIKWDIRRLPQVASRRLPLESVLEDLADHDPRWWNLERTEYFMNQLSPRHLRVAKQMISEPEYSYGTAFRRIRKERSMAELRVDSVAGCLRTPRGGSGRQILFRAGKGTYKVRLLTPRECARLQGVQDHEYKITARDNQALFGFGDAVCVPVVQWIAENYLSPLAAEMMRGKILLPDKGKVRR